MPDYINVSTDEEYNAAENLFKEYAAWLNIDLCFQNFEEELVGLRKMYAPPAAGVILAKNETGYIACIAIRKIDEDTAELKRMYVNPAFRQHGIGNNLLQLALQLAKKSGYKKIRLDTLSDMSSAINLYKQNGFYEIPPYYFNPESTAIFFEKLL